MKNRLGYAFGFLVLYLLVRTFWEYQQDGGLSEGFFIRETGIGLVAGWIVSWIMEKLKDDPGPKL